MTLKIGFDVQSCRALMVSGSQSCQLCRHKVH